MEELRIHGDANTCPVIAIVRGHEILIGLRNYTPDKWKTTSVWTTPGGRCDANEILEATLRREVAEEVGITDLQIDRYLGTVPGAKEGDVVLVFLGTTTQEPQNLEPQKFSEWRWTDIDDIPENFINPVALARIRSALES